MNNKKIGFAACSLLMALTSFNAPAKDWDSIQIATEGVYEPWNRTRPDGTFDGFEPEMAKVLCERMQVRCKIVAQDWDGLIPGLKAGKFDVVMDALAISPQRRQVIDFSRPYTKAPATFVALRSSGIDLGDGTLQLQGDPAQDTPRVDDLRKRLEGKLIGIVSGTVYSTFIHDQFGKVATIREYKTPPEPLMDLKNGRVDVVFEDLGFLAGEMQRAGSEVVLVGPAINGSIWGEGEAFGIRQGEPELKAKLDAAIASLIADGTISELSRKWFKHDFTPPTP
ncbi:transporter substrate-binding domain-containing protein [Pseudomonas sp. S 311-6]|uniref:transporter substrate-binding domain-containing protein n=1 Tax=Pseudomonas TaxID=286 RepID=UPI00209752BF|nr:MULTISPECIES: transporter substrate-binding domain-containing protein [Pseudomonas]MCO7636365.1 transporter substrate-binding domain-containing protein [Pseudomonas sp. S 311-6]MCO7563792.1 transporter substrate-binding domain-containing protein [Pseudomonas mosselii]MCO7594145.1 transporter substrate-binding domain-containing protein [Pseudomonas guariconensis]MCO7617974.1 transporter substrate-binding domain-containing protein [Pseudomonas guariconensis]MCU7220128.1 transporter substrate-